MRWMVVLSVSGGSGGRLSSSCHSSRLGSAVGLDGKSRTAERIKAIVKGRRDRHPAFKEAQLGRIVGQITVDELERSVERKTDWSSR